MTATVGTSLPATSSLCPSAMAPTQCSLSSPLTTMNTQPGAKSHSASPLTTRGLCVTSVASTSTKTSWPRPTPSTPMESLTRGEQAVLTQTLLWMEVASLFTLRVALTIWTCVPLMTQTLPLSRQPETSRWPTSRSGSASTRASKLTTDLCSHSSMYSYLK